MTNSDLAAAFDQLAKLMELHQENPFKIRSYKNVAGLLSKLGTPISEMSSDERRALKGVGEAIADKIVQLESEGKMKTLERYREMTPQGIQQLLQIKGIGPSKVRAIWKELGIESAVELRYACIENRLVDLKGFGSKTQQDVLKKLDFHFAHQNEMLYRRASTLAKTIEEQLSELASVSRIERTGDLRRQMPVVRSLEFIVIADVPLLLGELEQLDAFVDATLVSKSISIRHVLGQQINIYPTTAPEFGREWLRTTGPDRFVAQFGTNAYSSEAALFEEYNKVVVPPHVRDLAVPDLDVTQLVRQDQIQGVLHVHSAYSDGVNSIEELAVHAHQAGYAYLGITDHSQIAVYANGLNEKRLLEQWAEIEELNEQGPCRILKGIECDILNDGDLDYEDELRSKFEFVIASIHTNIKMDEQKATQRLVRAIEHPHTNIVGHPTGRLLLGRSGYPIDMAMILDACAANGVALELNCSPSRMDIDWRWIAPAIERGVKIALNPDAPSREAIDTIGYGVAMAQKGLLTAEHCLNCLSAADFLDFCRK
ncbi:MAG: PHP domain-containing protein [Saprospiraceae bacterium]|nr:PHP domain-containing protein [Saprospiraceae bacterium]